MGLVAKCFMERDWVDDIVQRTLILPTGLHVHSLLDGYEYNVNTLLMEKQEVS